MLHKTTKLTITMQFNQHPVEFITIQHNFDVHIALKPSNQSTKHAYDLKQISSQAPISIQECVISWHIIVPHQMLNDKLHRETSCELVYLVQNGTYN